MFNSETGEYLKTLIWAGEVIVTECINHSYAWTGKIPCTGVKACIHCGKVKENTLSD